MQRSILYLSEITIAHPFFQVGAPKAAVLAYWQFLFQHKVPIDRFVSVWEDNCILLDSYELYHAAVASGVKKLEVLLYSFNTEQEALAFSVQKQKNMPSVFKEALAIYLLNRQKLSLEELSLELHLSSERALSYQTAQNNLSCEQLQSIELGQAHLNDFTWHTDSSKARHQAQVASIAKQLEGVFA